MHREGTADVEPLSRLNLHYALYQEGRRLETSHSRGHPLVLQLSDGEDTWQWAARSMRLQELSWLHDEVSERWWAVQLCFARAPNTVSFLETFEAAAEEAQRHLELGRQRLRAGAYGQGRQAFGRARAALPEKLLLRRPLVDIQRFADLERASLLNQAGNVPKSSETMERRPFLDPFSAPEARAFGPSAKLFVRRCAA